jgi:hypothetical protein
MTQSEPLRNMLIAPCGMNCGLCLAYLRDKNRCEGCRSYSTNKPKYCARCLILNCELLAQSDSKFCYECQKFPCPRLKQLDKRYRTKYRMSMIENLNTIQASGLEYFLDTENKRWKCPTCGSTICVHRKFCLTCKTPV